MRLVCYYLVMIVCSQIHVRTHMKGKVGCIAKCTLIVLNRLLSSYVLLLQSSYKEQCCCLAVLGVNGDMTHSMRLRKVLETCTNVQLRLRSGASLCCNRKTPLDSQAVQTSDNKVAVLDRALPSK